MIEELNDFITTNIKNDDININEIIDDIKDGLVENMNIEEIYEYFALKCISYVGREPNFDKISVIYILKKLYLNIDLENYEKTLNYLIETNTLSEKYIDYCKNNINFINEILNFNNDYLINFFGLKTLLSSYLLKSKDGIIIETPQHMFIREAIQVNFNNLDNDKIKESYYYLSNLYYTHATPTLFNSGTKYPQLSSCYLLQCGDSIEEIGKSITDMMSISKWAGGIGINLSDVRGKGSKIKSNNGKSDGIIPLCKMIESMARYVNQSGKRNGAVAVYLEPWHSDIFSFVDLRRITGNELDRTRDLFLGLWIPDLFMKKVQTEKPGEKNWYLMSPDSSPGLSDCYGNKFEELYNKYVEEGKYIKQVSSQELYRKILESQCETGLPYMLYKDACNEKSNQKNLGTIKNSNLCVSGKTNIITDKGMFEIKNLVNKKVNIWNGYEFSDVEIIKTGENQTLHKIEFTNGEELYCTPYHKFYIQTKTSRHKKIELKADDIKENMKIIKFDFPIIDNNYDSMKYPYTHGIFCAEGTYDLENNIKQCSYNKFNETNYCKRHQFLSTINDKYKEIILNKDKCNGICGIKRPKIYLYDNKKQLLKYLDIRDDCNIANNKNRITVALPQDLNEKYYVPFNCDLNTKLRWLEGYADGDGCKTNNKGTETLQLTSINFDFLKDVKKLINTIGIDCKINMIRDDCEKLLPDGKGGNKIYKCNKLYRICVSAFNLQKLLNIGFSPKRLNFTKNNCNRNAGQFIKIKKITKNICNEDTYCFNDKKRHLGVFNGILTGNCSEIIEYSNNEEIAVCNLGSLSLPKFVNKDKTFNFELLGKVTELAIYNLNNVIDVNFYPVPETKVSNMRHRPIGLGVQGLIDVYQTVGYSFDSIEALNLNKKIFECIYYHSLKSSNNISKTDGPYSSYVGSPFSNGLLQFHLWGKNVDDLKINNYPSFDWESLLKNIKLYGVRNSLLTTQPPTGSTSQIMGNYESVEPYASNILTRVTAKREFIVINKNLVNALKELNLWNYDAYNELLYYNGSVQNMDVPEHIKKIYRTSYELPQKFIIQQSLDRGIFTDQTQSLNIFMENPDQEKLTKAHFYGWRNGIKTGLYYLRTKPAANAKKYGVDIDKQKKMKKKAVCNDDVCVMCSA